LLLLSSQHLLLLHLLLLSRRRSLHPHLSLKSPWSWCVLPLRRLHLLLRPPLLRVLPSLVL
jgi:hypothetical protein